ncbi:MAG: hypothetical protein KAR40_11025 [Candidatus Sabulitectum sp.]|nr:hypothetical protein [Candidatus Sabulitectum sp.]
MNILVACEESQVVTKAFRKIGHEAYSCDIVDCSGGHPEWHIKDDVLNHLDDGWDMMIAHPVCKRLTNAGVRWMKVPPPGKTLVQMWRELFDGAEFYRKLRDADIPKKAIENPIMHCHARELIKPGYRQIVQPWWFGDKAFKATGFELIGLPDLAPTNKLIPPEKGTDEHKEWSFIHRMPPGPDRERLRSRTFPGIADAMAAQWG